MEFTGGTRRGRGRVARRGGAVAAMLVTLLAGPGAAGASSWHQVTPSGGENIDEVALLRTGDGVLHVAWVQKDAANPSTADLATRTVDPAGRVLGPVRAVASGWDALSNPALTFAPGGVRAFFGGIRTIDPTEPNTDLNTAT